MTASKDVDLQDYKEKLISTSHLRKDITKD